MYRPWWSWIHADFTGDGVDDGMKWLSDAIQNLRSQIRTK